MLLIEGKTVYLTRGDNASIKLDIREVDGKPFEFVGTTTIVFTAKKNLTDAAPAVQITSTNSDVINFVPNDTKNLTADTYLYDIQLTTNEGKIYTIVPISDFIITPEVNAQ